ncbi:MAG: hypothetical protein K0R27_5088 [Xanthobacteraceae bacterium]|nr:hypothetical protein [Xanthobacteraceae bacterium]
MRMTGLSAMDRPESLCYMTPRSRGFGPRDGRIAQLVEQLTLNQRVLGSSPSAPTKFPVEQTI